MSIRTSLYSFLSGTSSITSTLASANSVWPQMLPQKHDGFPAIVYSMDDDQDQQLLDGVSGLKEARVVIDVYDGQYVTADTVATAIKDALIGYRGTFGADNAEHIRKERELDIYESETELHRINLQFLIAYY